MRRTFEEHLQFAVENAGHRYSPGIVAKEMLHFDLLRALSESPLGDCLVFQGGTALRICYNGDRLSEDLNFVCGGEDAEPVIIDPMVKILHEQMAERYGLTVDEVKGPKGQELTEQADVKRWEFVIRVPVQGQSQRIRLEVCNVPAHDAAPKLLRPTYSPLEHIEPIVLHVESEREILADKIVALAARKWIKYRDVWDLKQLGDRNLVPESNFVQIKAADYGLAIPELADGLGRAKASLETSEAKRGFVKEMSRFVSIPMARRLEKYPQLSDEWLSNASSILKAICEQLS